MRHVPETESDEEELKELRAESWMIELLKKNPSYTFWGPDEDYMLGNEDSGWRAPIRSDSWKALDLGLDDLNEVVNFYFEIERAHETCSLCNGDGYHQLAKPISDGFYSFSSPTKTGWHNKITQDEVEALVKHNRLLALTHTWVEGKWIAKIPANTPTAEEVNKLQSGKGNFIHSHDAINRGILIETRLKRLGLPKYCEKCTGNGYIYISATAQVNLVMWLIHPRKGASRGVKVKDIQQANLPEVFAFLKKAAARNAERFSKL